jgi:predicted ATPase
VFTKLHLKNFKSFEDAELTLGPFTLLVGANATGKSNIRDAFRFLHGLSRGYSIAEILGETWGEGGYREWAGIRGGARELAFDSRSPCWLEVELIVDTPAGDDRVTYSLEVVPDYVLRPPHVVTEELSSDRFGSVVFSARNHPRVGYEEGKLAVELRREPNGTPVSLEFNSTNPVLWHLAQPALLEETRQLVTVTPAVELAAKVLRSFASMQLLDLSPESMRIPSVPGQPLGERGENLSSALYGICRQPNRQQVLVEWIRGLSPMEATGVEFLPSADGRVLLALVEEGHPPVSANSASDGTLRMLAVLAAFLTPGAARFCFIDELETGIHPTRLHLLLELVERIAKEKGIQVVATSHSPYLTSLLKEESLEYAAVTYRLPDERGTGIRRILDIPDARRVVAEHGLGELHGSAWLENAVYFTSPVREAA